MQPEGWFVFSSLQSLNHQVRINSSSGANPNSSSSLSHLGATEVCLTLMSKFELESEDVNGVAEKLFVKTKHLVSDLHLTSEATSGLVVDIHR